MNSFDNQNIKEYEKIIDEIVKYGYDGKRNNSNNSSKRYKDAINAHTDLIQETNKLKEYVHGDVRKLDDILPKALAIISEAAKRHGMRPYPVQLMGAIALHRGNITEMKTGEGKTLTAVLAAYLNALTGKGVHITTSNNYLAEEAGYKKMGPILEEAGLTVGVISGERNNQDSYDLARRKKAYQCDVTYGSSDSFAFDYLYDNIAKSVSKTVLRQEPVGFVIIDEADQILVNNAMTPFVLSGNSSLNLDDDSKKDEFLALQQQQKENYQLADEFVYSLFQDRRHCLSINNKEQLDLNIYQNKKAAEINQRLYSVIYSKSNDAELTERGQLQAFYFFNDNNIKGHNISKIINTPQIKQYILNSKNFVEGEKADYVLENDGSIRLTLRGVERSIRTIPEMQKLHEEYLEMSQRTGLDHYINNALKAYFVQNNKVDYSLQEYVDKDGKIKKKVLLIIDGRTAEGRVYSHGLQQAIELKEKRLNPNDDIEMTKELDELASISQKAFYGTYSKVSGMTGTSAKNIFDTIYDMDTVVIPKNSEYELSSEEKIALNKTRINKPDVVFATEEEKLNAVIKSIEESQKKGQPVLIGTYSDSESLRLYRELQKRNIPCEFLNTENSNREAEIISKAGLKGSVTISTQMAGRGTDIKLGGDPDSIIAERMMMVADKMVNMIEEQQRSGQKFPDYIRIKKVQEAMEIIKKNYDTFLRKEELTKEDFEKRKEELVKVGGLKVIGYGHYDTKRNDDQLRGRAARQNDPGVTEFYSSIKEDLEGKLKIPLDITDKIRKLGLRPGCPVEGETVTKIINEGQKLLEANFENNLSNNQKQDQLLSVLRSKLYEQRRSILFKKSGSIWQNMEYVINSTVVGLIEKNLPNNGEGSSPKDKLQHAHLNKAGLIEDLNNTFGVDIEEAIEFGDFNTLGDVGKYACAKVMDQYHQVRNKNGKLIQDVKDKNCLLSIIDDAWLNLQDNLEDITIQRGLNAMVQNEHFDEQKAIMDTYNRSIQESRVEAFKSIYGKKTLTQPKVKKEANNQPQYNNEYYVFDKKKDNKIINFQTYGNKLMLALSHKMRLIKASHKINSEIKRELKEESINGNDDEFRPRKK